jgi:hypothetical protein
MADKELEQVVDTEAAQLDEFKATGDASMVADPVSTKSNKRPADKEGGEKAMPTLSKAGMIGAVVQKLTGFSKGGVNDAYSTIFGKDAKNTSGKNMASIAGKSKFKEDVEEIFDGQDLAEEFLDKAAIIFEASVSARVIAETARIQEEFDAKFDEASLGLKEEMADKVDGYLSYVAEQWMEENEVAIESSLKVDIAENFMVGLRELFENNYVEVPQDKLDLAADAIAMSEELEGKLDDSINEKIELQKEIDSLRVKNLVSEQSDGLSVSQKEKLSSLVEGIEYNDVDEFGAKLNVIKNQYFATKSVIAEEVSEDTPIDVAEEKAAIDPLMSRYASAISRTINK